MSNPDFTPADNQMTCRCGGPHDGWPGKDGGELCQMCWEAECSESWWRMAQQLPGAVFPSSEFPDPWELD